MSRKIELLLTDLGKWVFLSRIFSYLEGRDLDEYFECSSFFDVVVRKEGEVEPEYRLMVKYQVNLPGEGQTEGKCEGL